MRNGILMRESALPQPGLALPRNLSARAFTLIELLVVLAIIAILAALLLPGLSRAKDAGRSAACKSNLHQIGIALNLYTSEFQKYPVWITPDQIIWDAKLLPFAANNRDLFACPANNRAPRWTNSVGPPVPNPSYGYNLAGSGRYFPPNGLSLGLDGDSRNLTRPTYLPESGVKVPSDMVAIADATPGAGGDDHDADDVYPVNLLAELAPRHNRGANAVFCDDHVEYAKLTAWLKKTDGARQRWNNDHQPHPETWQNNP